MTATTPRERLQRTVRLGRRIAAHVQATEVTFLAAAVAYYAFLSLLPALLLLLAVASTLGGEALADALVRNAGELLTPAGQEVVRGAVENAAGRSGATIVGLIVLLWSVLKVFRGLDVAFLKVYGSEEISTLPDQLRDGLTAVLGIGTALVVMLAVGAALTAAEVSGALDVVGIAILPAVLAAVFLPLYYVFPDVDVTIREVVPGAVVAAIGWTLLQAGFQVYAANAAQYQTYGVLGGVLLLVTWFYLAAIVLLVGAVINVVLAGRLPPAARAGVSPAIADLGPTAAGGRGGVGDRQLQQPRGRGSTRMRETDRDGDSDESEGTEPAGAPDVVELRNEVDRLEAELNDFEREIERRTVDRPRLEAELKRYVRKRLRRGHARGWGPYLVLLYGTALTLGAFYWLDGPYAIAAMLILGLSTLGLYVLFVLVGVGLNLLGVPGRTLETLRDWRK